MKTIVEVEAVFNCSLERAFKTPILGDVTQFLEGYGPIPAIEKFTKDQNWGQVGGTRVPHTAKNLISKGGEVGLDEVYCREENKYWEWGVAKFHQPSMGFKEYRGQLFFNESQESLINVRWVYTLHSNSKIAYPFHWFFGKVFWKGQMRRAIKQMKRYSESSASFLYP